MKRILVTASHHKMADGLKDTLNFVSGGVQETIALSAYLDNQPVEEAVDELMKGFAVEEAKNEIKYVNDIADDGDDEDE